MTALVGGKSSELSPESRDKGLDCRARRRMRPAARISAISARRSAAAMRHGGIGFGNGIPESPSALIGSATCKPVSHALQQRLADGLNGSCRPAEEACRWPMLAFMFSSPSPTAAEPRKSLEKLDRQQWRLMRRWTTSPRSSAPRSQIRRRKFWNRLMEIRGRETRLRPIVPEQSPAMNSWRRSATAISTQPGGCRRCAPTIRAALYGMDAAFRSWQPISPAQWRSGEFRTGRLRLIDGEFIDIRLPRFMVRTIWPKAEQAPAPQTQAIRLPISICCARRLPSSASPRSASRRRTISSTGSALRRSKTRCENLASAMATLVRLPSSQRGGAKRIW